MLMKRLLIACGILGIIAGLICRVTLLTTSFEYDELFTAVTSNPAVAFDYIWKHYLIVDVHPPLYNCLLWLYNHLVPYGPEWILRLPSLLFSLLGLVLAWSLFPRYLLRITRWIFVLLLSCNFYLLLYAQQARSYSLMLCLSIVLTFLYLNIARCISHHRPVPTKWWVAYAICSLLLCWSHYFGALLFGLFSVILGINAWNEKQPLRPTVITTLLVLIGFSPWLVPNLIENLSQSRFSGNWWGNSPLSWKLVRLWIEFFFSSLKIFYVLSLLILAGGFYSFWRWRVQKIWPFKREMVLLLLPMVTAGTFTLLMSIKIFWLIWRYFTPFVPCLYLFVALLITPLCKRYCIALLLFLCFVWFSFQLFIGIHPYFELGYYFPARGAMEIYQQAFPDKDLYVVAMEAFPPESLPKMYAFYPHHYFHMNRPVYELLSMEETQRNELLARQENALMWMPNCEKRKLQQLAKILQRDISLFAQFSTNCYIIPAKEHSNSINHAQYVDYARRFENYRKRYLTEYIINSLSHQSDK